ncbi:asparagine synthase [Pycnococcus provasolii]
MCGILALLMSNEAAMTRKRVKELSGRLRHRGPDWSGMYQHKGNYLAHERLAIMDPASGDQPLFNEDGTIAVAANGEIYNFKDLFAKLKRKRKPKTQSDCEVISYLYEDYGPSFVNMLDGMFSFVLYDSKKDFWLVARDPIGITPLFVGFGTDGAVWIASELKAIKDECERVAPFPPGHVLTGGNSVAGKLENIPKGTVVLPGGTAPVDLGSAAVDKEASAPFVRWFQPKWLKDHFATPEVFPKEALDLTRLRESFERAVVKRLMTDVPFGVLLSGGLDSSLVASVACRHMDSVFGSGSEIGGFRTDRLHSFCIGLEGSPDLLAARDVAKFLNTQHHELHFTVQEGIDAISDVIYHIETYDVTSIRASTPMFLMSRKIKALGIKMVLSGEGSDEVFGGYLYFHKAPNAEEFHRECCRKIRALHMYDCARANKSTSAWGVEARVPFLDREFLDVAMNLDADEKMCKAERKEGHIEKWCLRKAFDTPEKPYLPDSVLWRQKEQFSDGVGYSWIDGLRDYCEREVSDAELAAAAHRFTHNPPSTKEGYLYRKIFEEHFGTCPGAAHCIPGGPSVACSTPTAALWDAAWLAKGGGGDPSGRAVLDVHVGPGLEKEGGGGGKRAKK